MVTRESHGFSAPDVTGVTGGRNNKDDIVVGADVLISDGKHVVRTTTDGQGRNIAETG